MSLHHKPVRQDYIAKVRYTNNLPPPPLNPRFIKYNTTQSLTLQQENDALMSSLLRKEYMALLIGQIDEEFGMPVNPLELPDYSLALQGKSVNDVPLHASDRALLRDAGIGNINKSEPGVSFLRRTEYIAERTASKQDDRAEGLGKTSGEEKTDPDSQLRAVEASFEHAQESLTNFAALKHPRKKHLKPVGAFPLLPDTSMMDMQLLTIKFAGSASLVRELELKKRQEGSRYDGEFHTKALKSAIFKPITSEDGEWVSLYQLKDKGAVEDMNKQLQSTEKEQPMNLLDEEEDTAKPFVYRHFKNYDMHFHRHSKPYEEMALKFVPVDGNPKKRSAALYYPITGRVELKKHRASNNTEINRFLDDSTADIINFRLREPNTNELKKMDLARSEYDPMEYDGEEEEEEEEDAEDAGVAADEQEEPVAKVEEQDESEADA
ncbi:hypothetical protein PUMCH_002886 [Australozyma saopauloensis]|uniref:RNA polymerase II-associated protein 1 n=1 Tax=Australozyma saopauloensis TaxID=291208 RepID=A0AAX4HB94_9ASCO|nr:hypothetical protein PUMCH_002886 [[Candida] saopauloensis]